MHNLCPDKVGWVGVCVHVGAAGFVLDVWRPKAKGRAVGLSSLPDPAMTLRGKRL